MKKLTMLIMLLAFVVAAGSSQACAGKADPNTVVTSVSNNATLVVQAVDEMQKFIIAQEAAGTIPRNAAVTAMEGIGRSLQASRTAREHVSKLLLLPGGSTEAKPLIIQIQDALTLASSEAALAIVPIGNEDVRKQVAQLLVGVSKAIGEVNKMILSVQGGA